MAEWIGLDVGGANLKAANGRGAAWSTPFALWREPLRLADEIRRVVQKAVSAETVGVALTMTGELADCYALKADGVRAIVEATVAAAEGLPVRVATVDDRWLRPEAAIATPHAVAAANWRVAARLIARRRPVGDGLWLDVGSTTADAIPIASGAVASRGSDDTGRLLAGELVYTGVRRTPVCATVSTLPYRGTPCPVAAELFATSADAWLLLGEVAEDRADNATADGRPFTRDAAIARLARCVCADRESFNADDALTAAEAIASAQAEQIGGAIGRHRPAWAVISGEGEFLARRVAKALWPVCEVTSAAELLGVEPSRCAPAHAAATLARQELEPAR